MQSANPWFVRFSSFVRLVKSEGRADAIRPHGGIAQDPLTRLSLGSLSARLSVAFLLVATVLAMLLTRAFHAPSAAAWMYLPLVLLITLRSGVRRGLLAIVVCNLLVLLFTLPPIGPPIGNVSGLAIRLGVAILGMLAAVLTAAALNRDRVAAEKRGQAEAETLADLGRRVTSSLDLNEVLRTAAESAQRLVGADVTTITVRNAPDSLATVAVVGNRTHLLQNLATGAVGGLSDRILREGRPLRLHWDELNGRSPGHAPSAQAMLEEGIVSTMALPIRRGSEGVGVFWVHARWHRDFSDAEVALLDRLAAQAAVAIANARVHAEEQTARTEVEALLAATTKLGIQAEPEAVLRTLIEQAASLLLAERAVYSVQRGERQMVGGHWVRGEWEEDSHEHYGRGISRRVWETGATYRSNDLARDPNASQISIQRFQLHSQLAAPLVSPGGERLGVVTLANSRRPEGFTERDERLLVAICETGAAILLRARETADRLSAEQAAATRKREVEGLLAAADQLNSAVEPADVLHEIVRIAGEMLAVRRVGITTNEGSHALLRHRWVDGSTEAVAAELPLRGSIAGWVIQNGRPHRTAALGEDGAPFYPVSSLDKPTTALAVPIVSRDGHILGALQLFDRRDGLPFSEEDQRLAEGIAHHAAGALERAALLHELRSREEHLRQQAWTDQLTGLANRNLFLGRLKDSLDGPRDQGKGVAVLFLDLDGFKVINESLGHPAGDELLVAVGKRLQSSRREEDTVARFGGDEFVILLQGTRQASDALDVAERLIADLQRSFAVNGHRNLFINGSIGVSFRAASDQSCPAVDMIREADIALYRAKAQGKGRAVAFEPSMSREARARMELQSDLRRALRRRELRLHYQPIVELKTQTIVGAEALLRWEHPRLGVFLQPDVFIPLAEETGLILPIGRWVLREACREAQTWPAQRAGNGPLFVSVNLSVLQLAQPDIVDQVASALEETGLDPSRLNLEITESAVIEHAEAAIATLITLGQLGAGLAIDDFGTGYSSLSYLQRLPVDTVKIDHSFVEGLEDVEGQEGGSSTAAIVRAIVTLAHALGKRITAEGIETLDQATFLSALGCDSGQGYYFARPCPASEFRQVIPLLTQPVTGSARPRRTRVKTTTQSLKRMSSG